MVLFCFYTNGRRSNGYEYKNSRDFRAGGAWGIFHVLSYISVPIESRVDWIAALSHRAYHFWYRANRGRCIYLEKEIRPSDNFHLTILRDIVYSLGDLRLRYG